MIGGLNNPRPIDDVPVNGNVNHAASSNRMFDHEADYGVHNRVVRKTSDETVNDSDTLQNDDELLLAIGANEVWAFELLVIFSSGAAPDFKYKFTMPVGGDVFIVISERSAANATINTGGSIGQATAASNMRGIGVGQIFGILKGIIINGANAGNFQYQWAQNTQEASDTKVLANSCIIAHQLA